MTSQSHLGLRFDEVPELFHEIRPRYPKALFDDMFLLLALRDDARVVEIGAGTGIATVEIASYGYQITALDPGQHMLEVARRNLKNWPNATFVNTTFEDWLATQKYDLVLSATAFHFLNPSTRYQKAADALVRGGQLALIDYKHVSGGDQDFFDQIQHCYELHMPGTPKGLKLPAAETVVQTTVAQLEDSHLFETTAVRTYAADIRYSPDEYYRLLNTYSNHRALSPDQHTALFNCIDRILTKQYPQGVTKRYSFQAVVAKRRESDVLD